MKATKMNINKDTKAIRNYTNAFNYRDAESAMMICISLTIMSIYVFMLDLEKNNIYDFISLLFGLYSLVTIYRLLKLNLVIKFIKMLNRTFFKIDNQYTKLILDAAFVYDYNVTVQNAMRQLTKHISSPYFNKKMAEEVMMLDNCITMLIDEDLKNNPKQISKSCYDMIYSETKQLSEKFVSFKNQYETQQELLKKEHETHLEETLKKYKSDLKKKDEQYLL